jgi:hypothetical protein
MRNNGMCHLKIIELFLAPGVTVIQCNRDPVFCNFFVEFP